ncbi:hypothetical protein BHE74_00033718 [Ensete ventricosum]|nr:hypothetical protein BHE74_00033718 [Ensete ventricosum]
MLVELLVMFVFKVVPHVDGDDDDDDDDAVIIGESTSDYKNKEAVRSDKSCPEQLNLVNGKAPYRALRTGLLDDRYVDRPLPDGIAEIDRRRSIEGE